jgi:hypothetical protein
MRKMAMIKGVLQACTFSLTPRRQQALAADPKAIKALRKRKSGTLLHEEYLLYTLFFIQNEANSALPLQWVLKIHL